MNKIQNPKLVDDLKKGSSNPVLVIVYWNLCFYKLQLAFLFAEN